jgi:anaerobic selenocysteine-containing dehydrogenase
MISMDVYVNETTRHADVILPSTFGFERDDYQVLSGSLGVRNRARFAEAVLEKPQGMLHDWEILTELCARILESRARRAALGARVLRSAMRYVRPRHYLELMLRLGPHGLRRGKRSLSLARIAGHGLDLGPLEARLPGVLATRNRRIRLAPEPLLRDVERLRRSLDQRQTSSELPMLLLGRRQLRSNNSWMHNSLRLVSGRERCTLLVNPLDATRLALEAGALAKISSQVGSVVAPVQISDEMMPGVVSLPHGWGHHRKGVRLRVAEQHAGTSINDVTDEKSYDELCGVTHLNGVPVRVEPVAESAHATAEVSG